MTGNNWCLKINLFVYSIQIQVKSLLQQTHAIVPVSVITLNGKNHDFLKVVQGLQLYMIEIYEQYISN